jgi:HAD superfamily hydrolase (TIGR01509 family)
MSTPALVIFDCDGTLVDSEELGTSVLVEMAGELGLNLPLRETNALFRGWQLDRCVAQLESWLGHKLPDDFVAQVRLRTRSTFQAKLQPIPCALDLVRALRLPMCVASSGPREKIELSLSLTGLLPYFKDRIYSGYEIGSWKPDPGLFLHAARAMGVEPADCAVVEDSLVGVQAGIAAGMKVFAYQPEETDAQIPSGVHILKHLDELLPAMGQSAAT